MTGSSVWPLRLLAGVALLLFALLLVELATRLPFPCDLYLWSESSFMTDMLKLANGVPLYNDPADLNGFIYSPGLNYLTYALLAPVGLALDIRFVRLVNVLIGLAAAGLAADVMTRVARDLGVPRRPACFVLAFVTAALGIFANPTAAVPHPDNLQTLHVLATLLLCYQALRSERFGLALSAMAVAGLGVMTKQGAALSFVGAGAALLLGHRWGSRRATALSLTGLGVGGAAIAALLLPPNTHFFTLEVPLAQGIEWGKVASLIEDFFRGPRAILSVLAPGCALYLARRGGRAGQQFTLAWAALGVTGVAPNVLPYLKVMGGGNSLWIMNVWLLVLAWPALRHATEARRDDPLVPAVSWVAIALILLAGFPTRLPPSEDEQRYCHDLIERVGADARAGKRVLLWHGTSPFIWNGVTSVPLDRGNTILELTTVDLTRPGRNMRAKLTAMRARFEHAYYDRVYTNRGTYQAAAAVLEEHYRQVEVLPRAKPPPLPTAIPYRWGLTLEYLWMPDLVVYEAQR